MKTCTQCGKNFSDSSSFCTNCGAPLNGGQPVRANVQSQTGQAGNMTGGATPEKVQQAPYIGAGNAYYPNANAESKEVRGDFTSAPVGINIISIIGFVLAFLCVGFVWVQRFSIIVFPIAVIALVFCTIVKAMKYDNIFARIGFIVALIVTIVSGVVFGVSMMEMYY